MLPSLFHSSSDGAGRSGVYLAIDANIELSEEDGVFDVYGYLKKMRQQRRRQRTRQDLGPMGRTRIIQLLCAMLFSTWTLGVMVTVDNTMLI